MKKIHGKYIQLILFHCGLSKSKVNKSVWFKNSTHFIESEQTVFILMFNRSEVILKNDMQNLSFQNNVQHAVYTNQI